MHKLRYMLASAMVTLFCLGANAEPYVNADKITNYDNLPSAQKADRNFVSAALNASAEPHEKYGAAPAGLSTAEGSVDATVSGSSESYNYTAIVKVTDRTSSSCQSYPGLKVVQKIRTVDCNHCSHKRFQCFYALEE